MPMGTYRSETELKCYLSISLRRNKVVNLFSHGSSIAVNFTLDKYIYLTCWVEMLMYHSFILADKFGRNSACVSLQLPWMMDTWEFFFFKPRNKDTSWFGRQNVGCYSVFTSDILHNLAILLNKVLNGSFAIKDINQ